MTFRLRIDKLSWREIDDEVVILDWSRASYLSVNGAGARLWPALMEGATLDQLADVLVAAYEIDRVRARADAHEFVSALSAKGLMAAA